MKGRHLIFNGRSLRALVAAITCCCVSLSAQTPGGTRPMSLQEFTLLLRSGYTGDEALRETAGRPLLQPIDANAERALLAAGADAKTIETLKTSRTIATPDQAEVAQQQQAQTEQHRLDAWAASQKQQLEANRAAVMSKLATHRAEEMREIADKLTGKLVVYKDSRMQPVPADAISGKRIFLLYAAALRNATCHEVTPQLSKFYTGFAARHPEFELVLLSADRSAFDMELAMRQDAMPWPALAFDQLPNQPALFELTKYGVPRIVLIDGAGKILADSSVEGKFNPQPVFDVLLARTGEAPLAAVPTAKATPKAQ